MSPEEYFRSQDRQFFGISGRPVLFYPGAGLDLGPIEFLLSSTDESVDAIYVDYGLHDVQIEILLRDIRNRLYLGEPKKISEIHPYDFGIKTIRSFYPSKRNCTDEEWNLLQYWMPYPIIQDWLGFRFFFDRLTLVYIKADAIMTYRILQKNKIYPNIVVLQEHDGGTWTNFGGNSKLYNAAHVKPQYLYVADNTQPWPEYFQRTDEGSETDFLNRSDFIRFLYSLDIF